MLTWPSVLGTYAVQMTFCAYQCNQRSSAAGFLATTRSISELSPVCPFLRASYKITSSLRRSGVTSEFKNNSRMKIHEYQAKTILAKYRVAVPRGEMALTREEAETAAKRLFDQGAKGVVVKAQIHAGGRGKGGGVKVAKNLDEANNWADKNGAEGKIVQRLLVEERVPIGRDLYLGIVVDRGTARPVFMASAGGGME